jgi:hypothetical protein
MGAARLVLPVSIALALRPAHCPPLVLQLASMPACNPADAVRLHAQHGPLYWWRFLGRRMLMVGSFEAAKTLLHGENSIGVRPQPFPAA